MDEKLRHRPKTFMKSPRFKTGAIVQDSKRSFSSSNCSNKRDVGIYPAA